MEQRIIRGSSSRKGAAIVEFAVTLPIILLIVFATIEICCCFSLQQSLKVAAYQGCRVGLSSDSTQELVERQTKFVLEARAIKNFSISISDNPTSLAPGAFLTVRVNAPTGANLPFTNWIVGSRDLSASASMMTER
jgi:Flp pilus assembly protein TadG